MAAAVMAVLASLLLLVASCSPERPDGQAAGDRQAGEARENRSGGSQPEEGGETSEGASQPEPEGPLVPIAHLTSCPGTR